MTAVEVPDDQWFFVPRTHIWYQKTGGGVAYVTATQVGSTKVHLIANEEEIELKGK